MLSYAGALVILLKLLILQGHAALTSSLSSYLTLASADYTLNLTFSALSIPSAAVPTIVFSNRYSITPASLTGCGFLTSGNTTYNPTTCSIIVNTSATTVTFPGVYSSAVTGQTSLSLKFSIKNPWAATTESYSVAIVSGASNVASDTATITYSASPLRDCSWISSSDVNGAVGTRKISFVPSVGVITNSYLSISLPFWFGSLLNLAVSSPICTAISNVNSGLTCSNTTNGASEVYQVSNLFVSNETVGIVELNISSIANPWSMYPFGPISYSLVYAPAGTAYVYQTCTGITQTTTNLNSMASFGISFFSFISFTSNFRTGWFKITNPLPASTGELHITWNGGVSISVIPTGSPTLLFLNSSYIILGGFSSDYYPNSNISVFNRFSVVAPRSSRPFTITATTYYSSGGSLYGIDNRTNTYACSAGSLSPVTLTIGSTAISTTTWLDISLTLQHAIYSGSFIGITFPGQIIVSGTCSTNSSSISCLIANTSYVNLSVTATVTATTVIRVSFTTITNPSQALTSSSFSLTSYIDSLFDGVIDRTTSGLTLTFVAAPLPSDRLHILPSNLTTHAPANYTISVTLDNQIPANGSVLIVFPTQISMSAPTFLDASFDITNCTLSLFLNNLTLLNCFPTGLSTLSIYLVIGGLSNPSSLAPTDPFQLYTSGTTGTVDYLNNGPTVTMTQLAVSNTFTISASSTQVQASATYTFSIGFYSTPPASNYLLLTLPGTMAVPSGVLCSPISGVAALNCLQANHSTLKVVLVGVPANSISFSVSTLKNDEVAWGVSVKAVVYNSQDYATEQTPQASLTFTSTTLSVTYTLNDQFALYLSSHLTFQVTAPFSLSNSLNSSSTQLLITLPNDVSTLPNTTCYTINITCSQQNASTFVFQGVGLSLLGRTVTFQNIVPNYSTTSSSFIITYLYSNNLVALISNVTVGVYCTSPCQQCLNITSACLSCLPAPNPHTLLFAPNSSCLSSCPDGYFSGVGACTSCLSSCATCNSSSTCLTCAPGYFSYNSTCTNTCPNGSYLLNSSCLPCDAPCATCNISATYCLTCIAPSVEYLGNCQSTCPNSTYNESGSCSACNITCKTCILQQICSSCQAPYYLSAQSCLNNCPSGTLANTTTRACESCAANCTSCQNNTNTCTTCLTPNLLYNHSCVGSCPSNYFNVSGTCLTCTHCLACLSPVFCSQCLPSYYLFEGVCDAVCPSNAPVADPVNMLCSRCVSQCLSCNAEATYCYSCASSYLSLQGKCYSNCPSGYDPDYSSSSCKKQKQVTLVYAPVSLTVVGLLIIVIVAKIIHPSTGFIGNTAALTTVSAMVSLCLFTAQLQQDEALLSESRLLGLVEASYQYKLMSRILAVGTDRTTFFMVSIASLLSAVAIGIVYVFWFCCRIYADPGLKLWRQKSSSNRYALNIILALSCLRIGVIRVVYSRWFGRECFSCYLRAHALFLKATNFFTIAFLAFVTIPCLSISLILLTKGLGQTQTKIYALDCLIISSLQFIALVLDMCTRDKSHFIAILTDIPYMRKFRKYQDLQSSDGSLISIQEPEEQHPKTEADANLQPHSLGAFGTFSEDSNYQRASIVKTLPQHSNLNVEVTFDPYEQKRRNDQLFFQQRQYTNKFKQLKQSYQKEEEAVSDQGDQFTENQNFFVPKSVQQIIRQLPSSKHIKTVQQMIKQKPRQVDPAEYLKHASPEDYQPLAQDDNEFLMSIANRHGLDTSFVKETLGVKKHFNPTLLSKAIDYHQIVSSSVQKLINPTNSQQALQQVLGRDSKIAPEKLKALLEDKNHAQIIKSLFSKQAALFDPQSIENILCNFTLDFLNSLVEGPIDKNKLSALLTSCKQNQGEVQALKTLQKIGSGEKLNNSEIIQNIIGAESQLDPTLVPKVAAQMSPKSRANIFGRKCPANSTMIRKVINNKSIRLQPLNPIQQIPEIVEQFAELLNCGNEKVQRELTEVLEQGTYDGQQLKNLVSQAGNSQQQMSKLLAYINQHKSKKTQTEKKEIEKLQSPVGIWPETPDLLQQEQQSYLDFDIDESHSRITGNYEQALNLRQFETESRPSGLQKLRERPRLRRKEVPHVHLPSEHIYLQRIQGPHEAQRRKNIRSKKKKGQRQAQKFMDQDNEIYDLDF